MAASQPEYIGNYEYPDMHTVEAFIERWGEKSVFTNEQLERLFQIAEKQYGELAYHNFEHVKDALWAAMDLSDRCETEGIAVNRMVLIGATLFHDAGYHLDHKKLGYETKEELSIEIFINKAGQHFDYSVEDSAATIQAIRSTTRGVKPQNLEDKVMIRADLANVFSDYTSFVKSSYKLYREKWDESSFVKKPITAGAFMAESLPILADYFVLDLSLGDFEGDNWRKIPLQNIERMVSELSSKARIEKTSYITGIGSAALSKLLRRP